MTTVLLTAMVQVLALGADPQDFDQACRQSLATRRPLVVLVGANWCAACQIMQKSTLPEVEKGGGLNRVVFMYVDFDQQQELASRLALLLPPSAHICKNADLAAASGASR